MADNKLYYCNVELSLDIIGGKWKPLIIHHIGGAGVIRYGELKRKVPNINERVLSRQLRELEESKIIQRTVYDEVPPRVEYSLIEMGKTLVPILNELGLWGIEYNQKYNHGEIHFEDEYNNL
ncbi:helix-turn-helix domain-containing protein [Halobacillus litoralis]|uniref:winged helix-turn-helix transcriptional regulator n=1 Tax=Halobacillus litoralis TaxID=45668 RepID=UPI001CFE96DD|nr:helix-turn-helix domain-containing protein [Halobacillus litoralis]WLR46612.1 helix-turn-helix domain-containing protein [Halobacillus litoralis]